jgi:small subunit ribosomal protein S16
VIADQRAPRDGRFIEQVGTYDPRKEPGLQFSADRIAHWMKMGAIPTVAVADLLRRAKTRESKATKV